MTLAATDPTLMAQAPRRHSLQQLWPVLALTALAVMIMSLQNLLDPMLRYDDFPALLADPSGFWAKTLHEGRWVNYLWHLRDIVTPAWLNFAIYQVLWACFAASLAVTVTRPDASRWFAIVLALFVLVAPPATLISLWFNTLLPGIGLVALYAVLGCVLSQHVHRLLMPVFVIISFMAYTTYPVLVLAVCIARTHDRSARDLLTLIAMFVVSFAAAVLAVYAINWYVHGIFGVPLADWRDASPASDIAGMMANLPLVAASFGDLLVKSSFGFVPAAWFHLAMLCAATGVLLRRAPLEAAYLHAGLWMGMALVVVQILKLGVDVPPRSFIFAWVFYGILVVRAAQILSRTPGISGRLARNFVLLIVASYLLQTFQQYGTYRDWQSTTRALADNVAVVDGPVVTAGDVMQMPVARKAGIQNARALEFRLQQLAGKTVPNCPDTSTCAQFLASNGIQMNADATVITLP